MKKNVLSVSLVITAVLGLGLGLAPSAKSQNGAVKAFSKVCNSGAAEGTGIGVNACPRNPVQGPRPNQWGCTLDRNTQLLWEVKTLTGLTDFRSRFTNFDNTVPGQFGNGQSPTQNQINGITNAIGYVNAVNAVSLCGRTSWLRPTLGQIQSVATAGVSPQLPVAYFPDLGFQGALTAYGPTLTSTPTFNNPTSYQGFRISNGAVSSSPRLGAYPARLVTQWNNGVPCGGPDQPACQGSGN